MFKTIGLVLLAAIVLVLAYAATRPDSFRLERSLRMQAPPEKIFPLINDLHAFNTWNPYNQKDPAIQLVYSGPAAGPGSSFTFDGNRNVGKGSIEITGTRAPTAGSPRFFRITPAGRRACAAEARRLEGFVATAREKRLLGKA